MVQCQHAGCRKWFRGTAGLSTHRGKAHQGAAPPRSRTAPSGRAAATAPAAAAAAADTRRPPRAARPSAHSPAPTPPPSPLAQQSDSPSSSAGTSNVTSPSSPPMTPTSPLSSEPSPDPLAAFVAADPTPSPPEPTPAARRFVLVPQVTASNATLPEKTCKDATRGPPGLPPPTPYHPRPNSRTRATEALPEVASPMTPRDDRSGTDARHAHRHVENLPEYEEDSNYGGDTFVLTAPRSDLPDDGACVAFDLPADLLQEEEVAPAGADSLPPYARAFVACPSSRLQEVPRRLKAAWQAATKAVARAAMDCRAAGDEPGYNAHVRLFIELPSRTLALPVYCSGATRTKLQRQRLLDITAGKVPAIPGPPDVASAQAAAAAAALDSFPHSPAAADGGYDAADEPRARPTATASARQAKRLIEQGLSSRALRALERGEPAVASEDTLQRLEALHPPNPTDREREWPATPRTAPPRVTAKHLARVLKELPRGSAPGPSGWTFELISAAVDRQPTGTVAAFLIDLAQRALRGTLHWRGLLTASRLVALKKPDGGVRPIAVGEAIYRVIGRLVLKADRVMASANAAEYVGRHQYGVAFPGGVEAPVHAVRELYDSNQLRALVSLDWRNAFNSLDRVHTARLIADRAPALARLYEWSYREDSVLVLPHSFEAAGLPSSLLSQAGVRQGDVLGPLFFSIGAAPILEALDELPYVTPRAYLDDIIVTIPHGVTDTATKAAVAATFATAEREGAAAGLRLNRAKSTVWANDADALIPANSDPDDDVVGVAAATESCTPVRAGLKILGAPVGTPAFVSSALDGIVKRALDTLDLVAGADLPLQHKLILLRQCVAQIPTFWARAVPGAERALAVWDAALLRRTGALVGLDVRPGSLAASIAHLPVRLGGLGLRSMEDTAPRAFVASVLFAAALANTRHTELVCSPATAQRLRTALPELAHTDACNDVAAWRRAIARGVFPDVDTIGTSQLQRALQGMADAKAAHGLRRQVPLRLATVFEDAATPGSGAWLAAVPSDPTLKLPDAELAEALRAKMLTTTANAASVCPACSKTAIDPSHAYTCCSLSHLRTARHDVVVRRVELACRVEKPVREHVLTAPVVIAVATAATTAAAAVEATPTTTTTATTAAAAATTRPGTRAATASAAAAAATAAATGNDSLMSDDEDDANAGEQARTGLTGTTCPGHYAPTNFPADDTLDDGYEDDEEHGAEEEDDEERYADMAGYESVGTGYDDDGSSNDVYGDDDLADLDYEYSDQSVTRSEAEVGESPNPDPSATAATLGRAILRADLWLPATSTAVDVMVAASCRRSRTAAFDRAIARKVGKYGPALVDGTIAKIVPFVVSPFGVLSRPAKAFLKRAMGDTTAAKIAKARLRLAVAAVRGTARLSYAWAACAALSVGE